MVVHQESACKESTCDQDRRYLLCQSPCPILCNQFYTNGTP